MICASWMNYRNEQQYENQQDCQKQKLIKEQIDLERIKNKENKKRNADAHHHQTINTDQNMKSDQFIAPQIKDDQKYLAAEHQTSNHHLWNSNTQILSNRSSFSNISIKYQDNLNFVYSYIDIERLILDNLKQRIKELGDCGPIGYEELFGSNDSLDEKTFTKQFERKIDKKINLNKNNDLDLGDKKDKQNSIDKNNIHNEMIKSDREEDKSNNEIDEKIDDETDKRIDEKFEQHHSNNLEQTSFNPLKDHNENISTETAAKYADQIIEPQTDYSSTTKETRKQSKRKRTSIRNSYWAEFLKACEEDFELNQSKLNINYNSRALKNCLFLNANCVTNNWVFSLIEKEIKKRNQSLQERFKKLVEINHEKKLSFDDEEMNECSDQTDHNGECEDHQKNHEKEHQENHSNKNETCVNHNRSSIRNIKTNKFEYILPEVIYIVNLVPNQINIFRHCLYLQQTPNLSNFKVNFIAINLISGDLIDLKKKDLDHVMGNSINDELNFNYMNYFRSINRLTDVQIRRLKQKIRIRVTKNKQAIKMNTESDVQILFGALENNQEIDLSNFKQDRRSSKDRIVCNNDLTKKYDEKGNLLFLLDDIVDIGDLLLCIEDRSLEMSKLRKFIQTYLKQKEKISFNRLYSEF